MCKMCADRRQNDDLSGILTQYLPESLVLIIAHDFIVKEILAAVPLMLMVS